MTWTPERVAMLRSRWGTMRTAEIADEIMAAYPGFELTRNSVIGKANRLGLPKLARGETPRAPSNKPRPKPVVRPVNTIGPIPMGLNATALLTKGSCRFPMGHPGDDNFHYCGNQKLPGKSYCAFHHDMCTEKRRPTKHITPGSWLGQGRVSVRI